MNVSTYKTGYVGGPTHKSSRLFVYSLDGEPYKPLTITKADIGRNPGMNVFFECSTNLPNLKPGFHNLTVRVVFDYPPPDYTEPSYGEFHTESNSTVFFLINADTEIPLLMPKNDTYTSTEIPLQFSLTEHVSWVGYSLDGQDKETIVGNKTLIGLSSGTHNITVYAQDEVGNTVSSETVIFNVKPLSQELVSINEPKPFPEEFFIIFSVLGLVVTAISLRLYFKKQKH
jgi:hypothetical protein